MWPAYFFLYPAGQVGLVPTTLLVVFPLTQVMMIVFDLFGFAGAAGVLAFGAGVTEAGVAEVVTTAFSWVSLMRIVGCEKVKL